MVTVKVYLKVSSIDDSSKVLDSTQAQTPHNLGAFVLPEGTKCSIVTDNNTSSLGPMVPVPMYLKVSRYFEVL